MPAHWPLQCRKPRGQESSPPEGHHWLASSEQLAREPRVPQPGPGAGGPCLLAPTTSLQDV